MYDLASLHNFFQSDPDQPAVDRIGGRKAADHGDLHHEPVTRIEGVEMRMRKEQEKGEGHPGIHADLEGENRERVGFYGCGQPLTKGQVAHWLNREILKDDTEGPGCGEVDYVFGPENGAK